MSELSCDTPFIGRNDTDDLSLYLMCCGGVLVSVVRHAAPLRVENSVVVVGIRMTNSVDHECLCT